MGDDGNPLGAVPIWDGGVPRTITAYAGSVISGGYIVYITGCSAVVSSGADSYVTTDLVATTNASGQWIAGMALHNAASGAPVAIATEGTYIACAAGDVVASQPVAPIGVNNFIPLAVGSAFYKCGRALTAAGSEGFFILKLTV